MTHKQTDTPQMLGLQFSLLFLDNQPTEGKPFNRTTERNINPKINDCVLTDMVMVNRMSEKVHLLTVVRFQDIASNIKLDLSTWI